MGNTNFNNSSFVFDDGLKEYTFKNMRGEVFAWFSINPANTELLSRYEKTVEFFNAYADKVKDEESNIAEIIPDLEKNIKEQINYMVNRDVADDIFGTYAPCCLFANGDFYVETVLETFGKIIEAEVGVRMEKKLKKISKYTAKYRK